MRKLLLGTTAVIGAALMGPTVASAQEAPTVRIGGYFRFNYAFVDQDFSSRFTPGVPSVGAAAGKSDFTTDTEVHVIVSGKAANGLTYGATIELQVDANNGTATVPGTTSTANRTFVNTDEMYMFVAHPRFGQVRLGDEDGPLGGLMNSGHITTFGTGGVDGDIWDVVIGGGSGGSGFGPRVPTTFPGDIGDNSKIIYLSPQFFGLDFGASFAFNTGEGEDTGCNVNFVDPSCDRANTSTGGPRRRNEYQLAARWRGSFGGVGMSVTGGYIGADTTKVLSTAAVVPTAAAGGQNISLGHVGAEATVFGVRFGGHYTWGQANNNWAVLPQGAEDDRSLRSLFLGAEYRIGPFLVGANYFNTQSAGSTSGLTGGRREWGWAVGGSYTLAPGLQLVAEYIDFRRREGGFDFATSTATGLATNNVADGNVILIGSRIAF